MQKKGTNHKSFKVRTRGRKLSHRLLSLMLTLCMLTGSLSSSAITVLAGIDFGESMGYEPEYEDGSPGGGCRSAG